MDRSNDQLSRTRDLLARAAEGDEQAYDDLIAHASNRLLKLTQKMLRKYPNLRRWEQTDDIFQNTAMRLHRSLRRVKPRSPRDFFGLAVVEIRRALVDLCRHHFGPEGTAAKYESDIKGTTGEEDRGIVQNEPAADNPHSLEIWSRFHEALERLPDEEREVTHLVWYGGMKQAEVAEVVGASVPTIKRRWHRARIHLQKMMDGEHPAMGEAE